jgi:hypothetical protein
MTYHILRIVPVFNIIPKILTVEICVQTCDGLRLFPKKRGFSLKSSETKFDKFGLSVCNNEAELNAEWRLANIFTRCFGSKAAYCMYTPSIHMAVRSNSTMARHSPEESMQRARLLTEEVPRAIVCSGGLTNVGVTD